MSLYLFGDIKQQIFNVNKNLPKKQKIFDHKLFGPKEHPGVEYGRKRKNK